MSERGSAEQAQVSTPVPPVQPSLGRATRTMAVATAVSRLTGFARTVVLVAAIGLGLVGDAYNTANTLPNIVYELLLGGVLTSVIVPLLVHARVRDADDGLAYTQRLLTLLTVVLLVATTLAILAAPLLTYAYGIREDPEQVALANLLARILLVEIVFYGVGAMLAAILNSRQIFGPPAWAPVLNNLVVIATGLVFIGLNDAGELTAASISPGLVWLLGVGTTLGIVVQALALLPSLRRAGVRWAWRWDWRHAGLAEAGRLGLWVIGYVAVSQVGFLVIMALANEAGRASGVGSIVYANASLLFQLPYGIIGVALLTALLPRMSKAAAGGDAAAVVRDLSLGARLTAVALIPISALLVVLGPAIATVAFARGQVDLDQARAVGVVLAASAFGLFPYAVTMLQLRVFYAMKDARTPTLINLVMVAVRVPLCLLTPALLPAEHIVAGLAVANSLSFVVGAIVGELWLRRRMGSLETARVARTAGLLALASVVGALAAWAVAAQVESLSGPGALGSAWAVLAGSLVGGVAMLAGCLVLPIPEVRELSAVVRRRFGAAGGSQRRPDSAAGSGQDPVRSVAEFGEFGEGRGGKASQVESGRPAEGSGRPADGLDPPAAGERVTIGRRYQLLTRFAADEDTGAGRLSTWRARDSLLQRDVLLRIHAPGGSAARDFLDRALAAGVLSHPALAMVYDAVDEDRRAYVVGEWVDGTSMADMLRGGPLAEPDARETIRRVAEGVAQAHDLGLAVGGLSPERVILTPSGSVTVVAIPAPVASRDADVRALGALLFASLAGFLPLDSDLADTVERDRQLANASAPDLAEVALAALDGQLPTAGEMVSQLLAGRRRRGSGYADSGLAFITDRYEYDTDVADDGHADRPWPTISGPAQPGPAQPGPAQPGPAQPGPADGADYPTDRTLPISDARVAPEDATATPDHGRDAGLRNPRSWLAALPLRLPRRRQPVEAPVGSEGGGAGGAGVAADGASTVAAHTPPRPGDTVAVHPAHTAPRPGDTVAVHPAHTPPRPGDTVAVHPARTPGPPDEAVAGRPAPHIAAGRVPTDTSPRAADHPPARTHRADPAGTVAATAPGGLAAPPTGGGTDRGTAPRAGQTGMLGSAVAGASHDAGPPANDDSPDWLDDDGAGPERSRRTWLVLAFPVAALLAVAIIGWVIGSSIDGLPDTPAARGTATSTSVQPSATPSSTPTPEATPAPLPVASATVYDPFGDGEPENNDDSPLAFDGDSDSSWPTLTYRGSPLLGNLKPGVGLVFDLGREAVVSEITITTTQPGARVELRAGPQPAGDLDTFQLLGQAQLTDQTAVPIDSDVAARYWLVWITELVPDGGDFSASLGEVTFTGTPVR